MSDVKPLQERPNKTRVRLGNCSTKYLWHLINSGEIESYKDGRRRWIIVASIEQYVARKLAEQQK